MFRALARSWRASVVVLAGLLVASWAAVAWLPSALVRLTLLGLESPDPAMRTATLERLGPPAREGRLDPSRVAACVEDPNAEVRAWAAQVLMDTKSVRAFCSAALAKPTERKSTTPRPAWYSPSKWWPFAPSAPVTFRIRVGGTREADERFNRAFQEGDPELLLTAMFRVADGYGFERVTFSCARRAGCLDPPLAEAAKSAPNPDVRLLALVLLVLHHSCHEVTECIRLVEALPEPSSDDPAAPAIRFLKRDGFSRERVLEALRYGDEREQCWGLLVVCARPHGEYLEAVSARLPYDDEANPLHAPGILAARALGEIGDPAAFDVLRRTAFEGHYVQRARAIRALGRLRGADPQPVWIEVLTRPVQSLDDWKEACAGLAERGDAAALPALEAALKADLGARWHSSAVGALRADIESAIQSIRGRLPE